jgi:hypothetical protein
MKAHIIKMHETERSGTSQLQHGEAQLAHIPSFIFHQFSFINLV